MLNITTEYLAGQTSRTYVLAALADTVGATAYPWTFLASTRNLDPVAQTIWADLAGTFTGSPRRPRPGRDRNRSLMDPTPIELTFDEQRHIALHAYRELSARTGHRWAPLDTAVADDDPVKVWALWEDELNGCGIAVYGARSIPLDIRPVYNAALATSPQGPMARPEALIADASANPAATPVIWEAIAATRPIDPEHRRAWADLAPTWTSQPEKLDQVVGVVHATPGPA